MKKKILLFLFAVLLLPGNIYLVYLFLSSPARKARFKVEGNPDDFFCQWGNNAIIVTVKNNNMTSVGAVSPGNDFHWIAAKNHFFLFHNKTMIIDFNRDFLADYIKKPDGKEYIRIGGRYVPIVRMDWNNYSAVLPDGKIQLWKNNQWQELQKKIPY